MKSKKYGKLMVKIRDMADHIASLESKHAMGPWSGVQRRDLYWELQRLGQACDDFKETVAFSGITEEDEE